MTDNIISIIERYKTQKYIAKKLKVHPRTIRKWKSGEKKIPKRRLTTFRRMRGTLVRRGKVRSRRTTISRRQGRTSTGTHYRKDIDVLAENDIDGMKADLMEASETKPTLESIFVRPFKAISKRYKPGMRYLPSLQIGLEFSGTVVRKDGTEIIYDNESLWTSSVLPPEFRDDPKQVYRRKIGELMELINRFLIESPVGYFELHFTAYLIRSYRYATDTRKTAKKS